MGVSLKTKKTVFCAICLTVGLALAYIESLLPISLGIPGVKIGLPNLVTMLMLYTCGSTAALLVAAMRIILSGFMFGNLFSILYSAFGAVFSLLVMKLLISTDRFGCLGVSCIGGVAHNIGQLVIAVLLTNIYVLAYLPVLLSAGAVAGIVIGAAGGTLIMRLSPVIKKQFGILWQ